MDPVRTGDILKFAKRIFLADVADANAGSVDLAAPLCVKTWQQRGLRVSEDGAVDDVAEAPFQAAQRVLAAFPGGSFALVVGAALGIASDLRNRHDVQGVVELPVPGPGQSVAFDVAGGDLDGRDAGERRER